MWCAYALEVTTCHVADSAVILCGVGNKLSKGSSLMACSGVSFCVLTVPTCSG